MSVVERNDGSQPSFAVRHDYSRVPTRDGIHLHARLWRPETTAPLPVVINYDPYRSSDHRTLGRGNVLHHLARHGFIVVHLSVRGTDASEGVATDQSRRLPPRL
jgi:predicted acyl esterase